MADFYRVTFNGDRYNEGSGFPMMKEGTLEECRAYMQRLEETGKGFNIKLFRFVPHVEYRLEEVDG